MNDNWYNHEKKINNAKIGGAKARKKWVSRLERKHAESCRFVEEFKSLLSRTDYYWMCAYCDYDVYKFTENEYFEITKHAINLYPEQMSRVHVDKLYANNYYEVCKIMANHGMFTDVNYDKLSQAHIKGIKDPVQDIVMTALKASRGKEREKEISKIIFHFLKAHNVCVWALDKEIDKAVKKVIDEVRCTKDSIIEMIVSNSL